MQERSWTKLKTRECEKPTVITKSESKYHQCTQTFDLCFACAPQTGKITIYEKHLAIFF